MSAKQAKHSRTRSTQKRRKRIRWKEAPKPLAKTKGTIESVSIDKGISLVCYKPQPTPKLTTANTKQCKSNYLRQ